MPLATVCLLASVRSQVTMRVPCVRKVAPVTASTLLPADLAFHASRYWERTAAHFASVRTKVPVGVSIHTATMFFGAYTGAVVAMVSKVMFTLWACAAVGTVAARADRKRAVLISLRFM